MMMNDPSEQTVIEIEEIEQDELSLDEQSDEFTSIVESMLTPAKGNAPPFIDDLRPVVVNGCWTAREGDEIVVEKWNTLDMNHPRWMGTSVYRIVTIDIDGNVKLLDEELKQSCLTHITKGPRGGWRFRFSEPGLNLNQREKRPEQARAAIERAAAPREVKLRKDGQPRAKARPKHVIQAELKAIMEKRAAKQLERDAKRAERGLRRKST